jgi:hypothetical protein
MPQLDIINSSVSVLTKAPCSSAAPCYQVVMKLNNLSLAPTTARIRTLIWSGLPNGSVHPRRIRMVERISSSMASRSMAPRYSALPAKTPSR